MTSQSESSASGEYKNADSDASFIAKRYEKIYQVVGNIPRGKVLTYGQVADLAGMPRAARVAGAAMRALPSTVDVPWQRVVGKHGPTTAKINILDPIGGAVQRQLLEAEGIEFRENGSFSLSHFGWQPFDR